MIKKLILISCCVIFLAACASPDERAAAYVEKAQSLFDDGNYLKAELEAKNAIQIQPKNAKARYLLASIFEQRQEFPDMVANLRVAVESDPNFVEARTKLGTIYLMAGEVDLADEQAVAVLRIAPEDLAVRVFGARVSMARGNAAEAIKEAEAVLAVDPSRQDAISLIVGFYAADDTPRALELLDRSIGQVDDPRALRLMKLQLLLREGDVANVEREFRTLIDSYPDEQLFRYQFTEFLLSVGRLDEAERLLREIVEMDTGNVAARLALTQFLANVRGPESAERALLAYIDASPEDVELRLALGRLYEASGQREQALEAYRDLIDQNEATDASLAARNRLATLTIAGGDIDAGREIVDEVLQFDPGNAEGLLLRSALHLSESNYRAAVADVRNVLRQEPENGAALYLLARAHRQAGDTVLAKDAYRRLIAIDRTNANGPAELAQMLYREGDHEEAERVLRERMSDVPDDLQTARLLFSLLIEGEKYLAAEDVAKQISELPDQTALGDYYLGRIYQARGSHDEAIPKFRRALDAEPSAVEPLQALAASLVASGRQQEAAEFLEAHIDRYPEQAFPRTLLAQVLAGAGDLGGAENAIQGALQADETWLPAYLGLASLRRGDRGAQIRIFQQGLEANPGNIQLGVLLGTAYEESGRIDEAIEIYEQVLEVNPDSEVAANNLAALIADHRRDTSSLERALRIAEQFRDSENPAYLDTLGWLHYRLRDFDEAVPILEQAVDGADQVPVLRYHLGMAYYAAEDEVRAKEELDSAVRLAQADFDGIDEARSTLQQINAINAN